MIRVLLVDDQPMLRLSLHLLLNRQWGIAVVGEAQDGIEAIEAIEELEPDVVVMDLRLPRLNGVEATRRITTLSPQTRVIGYSMLGGDESGHAMGDAGAFACVAKQEGIESLVAAIRSAAADFGVAEAC
jgi:DNA-binding NarL/FixJ family response regulator